MIRKHKSISRFLFIGISIFFYSCSEIIFEQDISDSFVNLLAPTDGVDITTGEISFNWESVNDADGYQIQIATPNFANAVQFVLDSTISSTLFSKQLLPNSYEWRVKAKNSAFETNYFTNGFIVSEVKDFSSFEVILTTPINNLNTNEGSQFLSWESVTGAKEYRIQIWQPDTKGTLVHDEVVTALNFTQTFEDNTYLWQVRAQNETQNTLYFSRRLLVDTVNPNIPILKLPGNDTAMDAGEISFSWERDAIAGSKEFDSIYVYKDLLLTELVFKDKSVDKEYQKELTSDKYYWLVQSFDEAGNKSSKSDNFSVDIN